MTKKGKTRICLGIDWQKGFCNKVFHPDLAAKMGQYDLSDPFSIPVDVMAKNGEWQQHTMSGELFVFNSDVDSENCGRLIREGDPEQMVLTFDSHDSIHCSFPTYYDTPPPLFCFIRVRADWQKGQSGRFEGYYPTNDGSEPKVVWTGDTAKPSWSDGHAQYLTDLTADGRFPHCIWPPHCRVGTDSWSLTDEIARAAIDWEVRNRRKFLKVTKGNNRDREHFSAARAQIVHPQDPTTDVNALFIQTMMEGDEIWLTGQALFHCMFNTVWDTANLTSHTKDFKNGAMDDLANNRTNPFLEKCILFYDPTGKGGCTSPVPGVKVPEQDELLSRMERLGMKITTVDQYLSSSIRVQNVLSLNFTIKRKTKSCPKNPHALLISLAAAHFSFRV